jgi:hypothetical protein
MPSDRSLPQDYVRVTIFKSDRQVATQDSELPLSMDNSKPAPGPENLRDLDAQVAGVPLMIVVSAGPSASEADLAAADAIVGSIRPADCPPAVSGAIESQLIGEHTAIYPIRLLEKPGRPASLLFRYGADQLQKFLATSQASGAPSDGWRTLYNNLRTVTFGAPDPSSDKQWWVVSFELNGSKWHNIDFEKVERKPMSCASDNNS